MSILKTLRVPNEVRFQFEMDIEETEGSKEAARHNRKAYFRTDVALTTIF